MKQSHMNLSKITLLIMLLVMIGILFAGCGGHDTSSLSRALIGHWVTESGDTHYYFDSTSLVMLDQGRRMDQSYTVLESNEAENWIKIRVKTEYDRGHDKRLEFSSDRKTLTEIKGALGVEVKTRWDYVDSKKEP